MVRPRCDKKVDFCPKYTEFKPEGCPKGKKLIEIEIEEAEAVEKHGLLIIRLPKVDKARQTKLKVKSI